MAIGVGMPAWLYLNQFGRVVHEAFGEWPFLVGSAAETKQWRDVDVSLILPDEDYERIIGPLTEPHYINRRWAAFCTAFSMLGSQMTGLPIDFQIDQRSQANELYKGRRHALIGYSEILQQEPDEMGKSDETS